MNTETATGKTRLRKVAKQCHNYGQRVQNSVLECNVDAAKCRQIKAILENIIAREKDSLPSFHLVWNVQKTYCLPASAWAKRVVPLGVTCD